MDLLSRHPARAPGDVARAPSTATLITIGAAGLAAAALSVALALTNDLNQSTLTVVLATWLPLPYVLSGLVAWRRRPESRFGPLLVVAGFGFSVSILQWSTQPFVHTVGQLFDLLPAVLFLHVYLAYPTGRLVGRYARALVALAYAAAIGLQVVILMMGGFDPLDVLTVSTQPGAAETVQNIQLVTLSATCFGGVALLASRLVAGRRTSLRPATLLIDSFALGLVAIGVLLLGGAFDWPSFDLLRQFALVATGLAPLAFLLGVLDARLARSGVGDLLLELRADPAMDLREPLSRALRDPTLQVAYWLPQYGTWADKDGNAVTLPSAQDGRVTTLIDRDGDPVAALVHDPALADERELLDAVSAAAAIALENDRLQVELRARLQELQGSRSRVIEAGQVERKRLERDLHDGAQQRLVALSLDLAMLGNRLTDDPDAQARVESAKAEVALSLEELRDLARGIHPAVLSTRGLPAALQSLVARAPLPVRLDVRLEGRPPERVEVAAYYVVSESITNVGKHAAATEVRVTVSEADGNVLVDIVDDGVGGADTERGSGLRGLADRVEALGGRLRIWSPAGGGTRLQAEIPCG